MEKRRTAVGEMAVLTPHSASASADTRDVPLVVDLDETLVRTDSTIESLFVLIRHEPIRLLGMPCWLRRGLAHFKRRLNQTVMPDVHTLPFRADLLDFLREQRRQGRYLVLATGADMKLAQAVAGETGLFDRIIASDGAINLVGDKKRERLVAEFGQRRFDYVGGRRRDYPVWCAARKAWMVSASPRLVRDVAKVTPVEVSFDRDPTTLGDVFHELRALHWVKNVLVLLPVAAANGLLAPTGLGRALLAFVAFSLWASSVYLLNDLLDLPIDRQHPQMKDRRLASGQIRPADALALLMMLLASAAALSLYLSAAFFGIAATYFLMMMAYSVRLKDIPLLDVLVLSGGYALRVVAGEVATNISLSPWVLVFVILLFSSFTLVKRCAELVRIDSRGQAEPPRVCGYLAGDTGILTAQGIAGGYLAVLVFAMYASSEAMQRAYPRHELFWGVCGLLLYWINYLWLMVARRRMHHDPVTFAFADPVSRWLLAAMAVTAALTL
jgi:4-hydroxybenzoate polyprenyltransferase